MENDGVSAKGGSAASGKHTKIIATIGPASESEAVLRQMVKEGMNVARLNFSHGDLLWHRKIIKRIRLVAKKAKVPIGIMADLQGPRIRVGNAREFSVKKGEVIHIAELGAKLRKNKEKNLLIDFKGVIGLIKNGNDIMIEDGLLKLKVTAKKRNFLIARALNGGVIKPKKGINIPGISAKLGALTVHDREILDFALSQDVDFVAMSFVRSSREIRQLKNLIKRKSKRKEGLAQVIAKIERREAVRNFDDILKATDIVMVARGDLGIEMPQEQLPILQKEMVAKCLLSGKPVIVATQMLDSMIHNPRPTRAEISDVSNAVIDHADSVMLSGETASGKYPVETVRTMKEIILKTENSSFDDLEHGYLSDQKMSVSAAVAHTAHELAKDSRASAIVVASVSGYTARVIARHRPEQKLIIVTNSERTQNQLTLVWGAKSYILPDCKRLDELIDRSLDILKKKRLVHRYDRIILVAGRPHTRREHMSLVKVEEVK